MRVYTNAIKEDCMETTATLFLTEFFTATGYFDRLLFAFTEMENLHLTPRGKNQIQKFLNDSYSFISKEFSEYEFVVSPLEWSDFKRQIKSTHLFIESFIKLPFKSAKKESVALNYINFLYRNSFEFHKFLNESSQLEIPYPTHGFIEEEKISILSPAGPASILPLFFLNGEKINQYALEYSDPSSTLSFLQERREEKYDAFINKGHSFIAQKKYTEAKVCFSRARNYKETAEGWTLYAWSCALLDDLKEAKTSCQNAISLDPHYGPAYNDLGNYLLSEGKIEESLRWFEYAKRAINYQNREYPYINAGRAYVLLKKYEQALDEFSLALTIAPAHQELHETVTKIRASLEKSKRQQSSPHSDLTC